MQLDARRRERVYNDAYVQALFDRMGSTYDVVNYVSSLGFSAFWRRQCVAAARVFPGARVCDMMAGSGECWDAVRRRGGSLISIDFSRVMAERQRSRRQRRGVQVDVRCENALATSLEAESVDCVISAFGLKTLTAESAAAFAREIARILKPGGTFSLLEISTAEGWWLAPLYQWYVGRAIPVIGRLCLGDIECYRMLGRYTGAFGSCEHLVPDFSAAGLDVHSVSHFFGCATSLIGSKPASARR